MTERSRFIIFSGGVVLIMISIIIIRSLSSSYSGPIDYLKQEIALYIGIIAILIFAQFLIGTTYGKKSDKKISGPDKGKRYQNLKNKYATKFRQQKKKINELAENRSLLSKKVNQLKKEKEDLQTSLEQLYLENEGKLPQSTIFRHPNLFRYEQYYLTTINLINKLRQEGKDDFKIEASLAFAASIKLYDMLNILSQKEEGFTEMDLDDYIDKYVSDLNNVLNHVEALQYGMVNTYRPDSHQSAGLVKKHDQVNMRSFKIIGTSGGAIIFKALVEKKSI